LQQVNVVVSTSSQNNTSNQNAAILAPMRPAQMLGGSGINDNNPSNSS